MGNAIVQSATIQLKDQGGGVFGSVASSDGITSVSGVRADGEVNTISGLGFGDNGPSSSMFENFSGGTDGAEVTTLNSNFDEVNDFYRTKFTSDSRSGSLSGSMYQSKNQAPFDIAATINTVNFGAPGSGVVEYFTSFAIKVPSGSYFPGIGGGNAGNNSDYPNDSALKTNWMQGPDQFRNDMVSLSHVGNGHWLVTSNDLGTFIDAGTNPTWWKWGGWVKISLWVKSGADPRNDAGEVYLQITNGVDPIYEFTSTPVIFGAAGTTGDGLSPYEFNYDRTVGWIKPGVGGSDGAGAGVTVLFDDIYKSWGANSAARVELGDADTYAGCTDTALCEVEDINWSDGTIVFTAREGGLNLSANTWVYVILPDNSTIYSFQWVTA